MIPFEDPTTLSLLYHLNSEPWLNTQAYNDSPYEVEYRNDRPAGFSASASAANGVAVAAADP
jgi:hypothetical protein